MKNLPAVLAVILIVVLFFAPLVVGAWLIGQQFGWRTGLAVFLLVGWLKSGNGE